MAVFVLVVPVLGDLGGHSHGSHGGEASGLDADDPDFSGVVDFSNAIPGPDGSWCITKTKFVEHMVKDQVKECWHQNVTQCHDTYVTEFLPSQEQKCEETFWKSCKIDFREAPYNYTMKQCHMPLVKECDPPTFGNAASEAQIVCKTWFESECNTTFTEMAADREDLPSTWCKKVPRKICAPDNCRMVPGSEECHEKTMVSTIQKPSEVCDLQPQTHCRLITRLVPHLLQKEVCRNVPKEMCHLALSNPHMVKKPIRLRWCTKTPPDSVKASLPSSNPIPQYKPSYLPPPTRTGPQRPGSTSSSPTYKPNFSGSSTAPNFPAPTYSSPTGRPAIQFQRRSQTSHDTKFPPIIRSAHPAALLLTPDSQDEKSPSSVLIEDFFVQDSGEVLSAEAFAQPLFQERFRPVPAQEKTIQLPPARVSISDELSGVDDYANGVFTPARTNRETVL